MSGVSGAAPKQPQYTIDPTKTNGAQGETTGVFIEPDGFVDVTPRNSDLSYAVIPPSARAQHPFPAGMTPPARPGETVVLVTDGDGNVRRASHDDLQRMRHDVEGMSATGIGQSTIRDTLRVIDRADGAASLGPGGVSNHTTPRAAHPAAARSVQFPPRH